MSSPSKSPELSEKSRKYDRQIRLWGEHGQFLLENAQVCLVNVSGLGSEILKSLVLPGIGGFTIVDGKVVTEEDVGSNFFLDNTSVGQSSAKCCMQLLQELNPDVNGDYVDESIENLLKNKPDFFETFNVVIASFLSETTIKILSNITWNLNIPFIYCRSLGFIGTARLQHKEHCVIETHPDNKHNDLRIEEPYQSLKNYLQDSLLSPKVPWPIIVYKFLYKWRETNNKNFPETYKEKENLKKLIKEAMTAEEENYEEAIKGINSCFGNGKPSASLKAIMNDNSCINLNKNSNKFWILTKAVKDFINSDNNGYLPLSGILPDMTADTESYISLQNIYRQQAIQDAENVYKRTRNFLKELGLPNEYISEPEARLFCREFATIDIVRGTKIEDEYENNYKANNIAEGLETPGSLIENYVALRAVEKFQVEHGYIPGECHVETDTARLKTIACKLLLDWGIHIPLSDDLIHELCRYGGAEIHSVSAFIAGCVAHEVIKLITKQYKPINNTFIYNGITCETATFKL